MSAASSSIFSTTRCVTLRRVRARLEKSRFDPEDVQLAQNHGTGLDGKETIPSWSSAWRIHATTAAVDARLAVARLEHVITSQSFSPAIASSELAACLQFAILFLAELVPETSASLVWTIDSRSAAIARETAYDVQRERFTKHRHQGQDQHPSQDHVVLRFELRGRQRRNDSRRAARDRIRRPARAASPTGERFASRRAS